MAESFYFICYSTRDGEEIALRLADQLEAGPPSIPVWLARRKVQPGIDRYQQILNALRACQGILYLMTNDSVDPDCPCTQEWIRALKYKKPVIPLLVHANAEMPFRLEPRELIRLVDAFDSGLARLREHMRWRSSPEGLLYTMNERLKDARRDLDDATDADKVRIEEEITQLRQQISALQASVSNPEAAQERTNQNIERGLERERQPEVPLTSRVENRFINRPPLIPPTYFQDRHFETGQIGMFLRNENLRLMTVVGRGGVGKTAMVCRLLRSLEGGKLPDDGGDLNIDGIVYLSSRSGHPVGHPVNFPNLFYDLCKLVPDERAKYLDQLYKDPKQTSKALMDALLAEFPRGRTIVLLDNFEDVIDGESQAIKEGELDEALRAILEAAPHGLKVVLTTRVAPKALLLIQPGLQDSLELDQGLKSPYAENVLKAMDSSGALGLNAPDAPLADAREATRGFPRALEAVVGILRADRSTNLRGLLKELRQLGSKAEDVVRDLVGEAFNRLDPLAQEVMQALAIYGGPVPAVAVDYLLQPYRIGIDSSKTLGRLANMHFVRGEAGRFYLHQVDRDYALSRLAEGEPNDRELDPPPLTCYALRHRAADYFKETRKPREAWNTLEDLAPQLAEFELRVAGADYDAAVLVLVDIDNDYLDTWGHYRLLVDRYERLQGKATDPELQWSSVSGLASAYARIGQFDGGLRCFEHALDLARTQKSRELEAVSLERLAYIYRDTGNQAKAIDFSQQAIAAFQEVGNKLGEAASREDLASTYADLGRTAEALDQYKQAVSWYRQAGDRARESGATHNMADLYSENGENSTASRLAADALQLARKAGYRLIESAATTLMGELMVRENHFEDAGKLFEEAIKIADEASAVQMQMEARKNCAFSCLLKGDLLRARTLADEATQYRYPNGYESTLALAGVIALRQGDTGVASNAFERALREADAQSAGPAKAYGPAYTKALALAGLGLTRDPNLAMAAAQAYRDARAITTAPGSVMDELRLLDALALADPTGTLRPVRAAAAGEA